MNELGNHQPFAKWATGYSGCDGGDIGSAIRKTIWFCGIEWGGGHAATAEALTAMFKEDVAIPPAGYGDWTNNLAFIFNWQAMKLLSVICGKQVSDYKVFAEEVRPFTFDSEGYFKMNLYPLAFKNTSHELWAAEFSRSTGFDEKASYLAWIRGQRFPMMRAWAEKHRPRLIICAGITYLEDFVKAFGDEDMQLSKESIDDRQIVYGINKHGTLVVVIPFMVNRHGLTKNSSIQKFGEKIRSLM